MWSLRLPSVVCSHSQIGPFYQPSFWTWWPVWHQCEVPGGVPPLLGQQRRAPANHRCLPLKHSCLWAVARRRKTESPFMWMCECRVETQLEVPNWRFWSCNPAAVPWVALSERLGCGCRICKPANNCGLYFFLFVCANSVLLCFVDIKNHEKLKKVHKYYLQIYVYLFFLTCIS